MSNVDYSIASTKNNKYPSLKTDLNLCLPGSQHQLTHPNVANNAYPLKTSRDFADASSAEKWGLSVNGACQCQLALFSHGAGTGEVANVLEVGKGQFKDMDIDVASVPLKKKHTADAPAPKAQVIGWPPIRSFRKNSVASASTKNNNEADGKSGLTCLYVKVSMDGAPYLRKVDLKLYKNYKELSLALEKMFSSFHVGKDGLGDSRLNDLPRDSKCVLTYEDKDGDWMLVGDVPWGMFTGTCKRLRIMKG